MSELRKAIVTGAGSGIGRAVAIALLKYNFNVTVVGRREEALKETVQMAGEYESNALVAAGDVSNPDTVEKIFKLHLNRFNRLDLLFNNAGVAPAGKPIEEFPVSEWKRVVDINLTGSFLCAQQAVKIMKSQIPRGGRIVNNGSVSAQVVRPNAVAYNSTKHAILGLTKSICLEGREYGICCTQLDIGNAEVERTKSMRNGVLQPDGAVKPEALMDVKNIAKTILYLVDLPLEANVPYLTITANNMPFIGRG